MKKFALLLLITYAFCVNAQEISDTSGYRELLDLPYLSADEIEVDSLQRLNLVLPEGVENPPLLIWIGGGAWSFVNRNIEMNLARKFAGEGIAVASVGHRLSNGEFRFPGRKGGVKHPEHIKDLAAAFKWLYDHATEYGYDQENLFVGGFSSGAHLAALLAMDERYLRHHDLSTKNIKGIIPVAGAYDLNHYYSVFKEHEDPETRQMVDTHVRDVFGDLLTEASPTTYLDNLNTPMLLISEGALYDYTNEFEKKLWESDYRDCQIYHVFDKDHGGLWRDISNAPNSQTRNLMIDFIRRNSLL